MKLLEGFKSVSIILGVVKRIIPAVASTNAAIAGKQTSLVSGTLDAHVCVCVCLCVCSRR